MTAKRDLKRRVRQRQARTGESYVTARRRVVAARAAGSAPEGDPEDDDGMGREPADDGEPAASSEIAEATLPGLQGESSTAEEAAAMAREDSTIKPGEGGGASEGAQSRVAAMAEQDSTAEPGEGGGASDGAASRVAAMAEKDSTAEPGEGGGASEGAQSRVAAMAEKDSTAEPGEGGGAPEELRSRAAAVAATAEAGARANLPSVMGPATAAAVMEAVEISAAMRAARAEGVAVEMPGAGGTAGTAAVVELQEVTAEAALLGFRCRITLFPSVLESAELANVLLGLRDALVGPGGSTGKARMFDVAFGLPSKPQSPLMVRLYPPTAVVIFDVAGRAGPVEIACRLWYPASTLILRRADETELRPGLMRAPLDRPDELLDELPDEPSPAADPGTRLERELLEQLARLTRFHHPPLPALYIVDGPRRHRVTRDRFLIGRDSKHADLAFKDGMMSRVHAAVIYRHGAYYMKDLSSTHGIRFRGMLIDNKRIHEGDVFVMGDHELLFTYIEEK